MKKTHHEHKYSVIFVTKVATKKKPGHHNSLVLQRSAIMIFRPNDHKRRILLTFDLSKTEVTAWLTAFLEQAGIYKNVD